MSDSSQPHGLQPTRLLRPWDFPGKSTGVGCHCLLLQKLVKAQSARPHPQYLIQQVGGGVGGRESTFLTDSEIKLMLLVWQLCLTESDRTQIGVLGATLWFTEMPHKNPNFCLFFRVSVHTEFSFQCGWHPLAAHSTPKWHTPALIRVPVWSLQGLVMRHAAGTCRAPMLPRLAAVGAPGNPAQMTCLLPDLDFLQPCSPTTISNVKLLSCCLSSEKQGSTQVSRQGQQSRSLTAYLPSKSRVSATVVKNLQVNSS